MKLSEIVNRGSAMLVARYLKTSVETVRQAIDNGAVTLQDVKDYCEDMGEVEE